MGWTQYYWIWRHPFTRVANCFCIKIVGMVVFSFLVVAFYVFLGPFLGNGIVENTEFSVVILYIRCTWNDPSDRTNIKKNRATKSKGLSKLNYKFILYQVVVKLQSKHCQTCDRCVDGFDHHCRWLNNCIRRKNYTTFILLMVFIFSLQFQCSISEKSPMPFCFFFLNLVS